MSQLQQRATQLGEDPRPLSMQQLPTSDVAHCRDHLRFDQTVAADVVSAIYYITQTKQGISSIELRRRLGVTQTTAWKIKHKLKQVMLERDSTKA